MAAPDGTSSPRRMRSPAPTFGAAAFSTTPTGILGPRSSSSSRRSSGTAGQPTPCWRMSKAGRMSTRIGFAASSSPARSSTCGGSRRCPPGRRAIRFCCRPATLPRAGLSAPATPTPCSPCTGRSKTANATTTTSRVAATSYGRDPNQLKVFPAATFVIGDSADDAQDKARHIRHQQVSGATAIAMLEQVWGRDLSDYDPDGPLPEFDPAGDTGITQGRVRHGDPVDGGPQLARTRRGREACRSGSWSSRSPAGSSSSAPPRRSPTRSTATSRPTHATDSSWCRT